MHALLNKFKKKEFIQNLFAEIIANLTMLVCGIVIGYYFKIMFF